MSKLGKVDLDELGPNSFGPIREMSNGWVGFHFDEHYVWTVPVWAHRETLIQNGFEIGTYNGWIAMSRRLFEACTLFFKRDNYADLELVEFLNKLGMNRNQNE